MRTISNWIDEAKTVTGSDYATAKRLGTSRQNVSHYRAGRQLPSVKVCERLAEILNINPLEIIASCEIQKDPNEARRWQKWLGAAAILSCVVMSDSLLESVGYDDTLNVAGIYIMRSAVCALVVFMVYTLAAKSLMFDRKLQW